MLRMKSEAETKASLYDAKMKKDVEPSNQTVNSTGQALGQGQGADDLKRVTGKSLQEMENMSNAETEALAREIEKKYGVSLWAVRAVTRH